ncbi:hypothetical protein [Blautia hansenii]|uniref:hypothetical protein n=1 Tax=Blautia hansenii TaxID=1322 RepID=UPI0022E7F67E|nr:hypothetical protein [Blautia hansenii]
MCKRNKIDIIPIILFTLLCILSLVNFVLMRYERRHPKELELQNIKVTDDSILLSINNQQLNISKEKLEDNLIIDIRDIVDWNTDGTEIALSLANGNELYTTQTQNIYAPKFKNYVGFNEIQSVEETETEIHITAKDGNVYTIEK